MRINRLLSLLWLMSSPLLAFLTAQTKTDVKLTAQLRSEDQLLLEAVHSGNRSAWNTAMAPDFIYIEEGGITTRAEFLKQLEADGATPLRIRTYELHRFGDTAIVLHHDDIPASPVEIVRAGGEYVMSETWQRIDGVWKLHIVHVDSVRTDPPTIPLSAAQMDEVTGTYRSGQLLYTIRREHGLLIASRAGDPDTTLLAETRDVFFVVGETRTRRIFERDKNGVVTGFVRRDENSDRLWVRTATAQ